VKSTPNAKRLRRDSTDAEKRLWAAFRNRRFQNYKFRRQHPIGKYIVDFACIEYRLIIEADGGQHMDTLQDIERTKWLESKGWRVMRFWNNDILANTNGILDTILQSLEQVETPSPSHSLTA